MRTWKVALFDRAEAHAIQAAQRSISIAFPLDGPDAVSADDPRRTTLRGIGMRNDPITEARLLAAREVLDRLVIVTGAQTDAGYWIEQLGHEPSTHAEQVMIDTLRDARLIQQREVTIALKIVEIALSAVVGMDEQFDTVLDMAVEAAEEAAR